MADLQRATEVNEHIRAEIANCFEDKTLTDGQVEAGRRVRMALENAVVMIIAMVPPCPDRSTAIRKIREARMDCMSAISHKGRY